MTFTALVLALLTMGDTVVLKDKARVSGRFVRLADLVDADRSADAARERLVDVYLGRAPEEGEPRIVTLDEIRRELDRRGIHPDAFTFVGKQVEVSVGGEPANDALRRAIAFEIKRHFLQQNPDVRPDEMGVRIVGLHPEDFPPGCEVAEVRARGASAYTVVLVDPAKKRVEVEAAVRFLRPRLVAFAAREINPGRPIERADLEVRRVESSDDEAPPGDIATIVGASAAVRIRQGAKIALADLKLKAVIRRGDVVRAVSSAYEVDARALEDGAPGQEIALEFAASKNRFRARVAGAARVEVVEGGR